MRLPTSDDKDLSIDEWDLRDKVEKHFNKEYILSIYADIDGYSIIVMGRIKAENNRNYIIYYSQHNGKIYGQKLLEEIIYLKSYFKHFSGVYCNNNPVLKLLIDKNIGKEKYNGIDFKIEEINTYMLSIELLIGLDKLRIHPLIKDLGTLYQDFNPNIKSYPIYTLMLPLIEYDEKHSGFWFGFSVDLEKSLVKDYTEKYYNDRGYY